MVKAAQGNKIQKLVTDKRNEWRCHYLSCSSQLKIQREYIQQWISATAEISSDKDLEEIPLAECKDWINISILNGSDFNTPPRLRTVLVCIPFPRISHDPFILLHFNVLHFLPCNSTWYYPPCPLLLPTVLYPCSHPCNLRVTPSSYSLIGKSCLPSYTTELKYMSLIIFVHLLPIILCNPLPINGSPYIFNKVKNFIWCSLYWTRLEKWQKCKQMK